MLKDQKETPNTELLKLQSNADSDPNSTPSSELIERVEVVGTPFHVIGNEEKGYFLSIGKYRLTENRKTKDDALAEMNSNMWNIMMNLCIIIYEGMGKNGE